MFKLHTAYSPSGDQPAAIDALVRGLNNHHQHQCLLGVTGSGKTFTMANVIAKVNRPTLILAHNKTLAAQLYSEFREFFPENAVHYFVSYFDYYQPEAYIAASDTYIEKDSAINEEIDRLRHGATESLLSRRDVIIVASVSCIYGLGSPAHYQSMAISIKRQGDIWLPFAPLSPVEAAEQVTDPVPISTTPLDLNTLSRALINMQYHRNDLAFERGNFRIKGETLDLYPAASDHGYRFNFNFDQLETVKLIDPLTGEPLETLSSLTIFPNTHYATPKDTVLEVIPKIHAEFEQRHQLFLKQQKYLEAERLSQRVRYDLEMLAETGFVKGIENYSRYLDGRKPGQAPYTLLDFFPPDFLLMIDESHMTIPQVRGMYNGDHARKLNLVEYGFRLPSALDNRPLNFGEFEQRVHQTIYVSATPGPYELEKSGEPIQQVIRPTGLLDPEIEVRPTDGQIDDLISEITARINKNQRVLITTLTKRMAEDLTEYLQDLKIKTAYLHSDIDTLERGDILRDLRSGVYDVLIGINLLREGLDLPEVSLVAILDADKEGFLRSNAALIQTIGRAARHLEGHVIMYADRITDSMASAIDITNQRRELQSTYNREHHITPRSIEREVSAGLRAIIPEKAVETPAINLAKIPVAEYKELRKQLVSDMQIAAADLDFERAATLRDAIKDIDAKLQKS